MNSRDGKVGKEYLTKKTMKYVSLDDVEKLFKQMISDANSSMYPEWKVLEMKEFNMFSCWKASIEIAKDRVQSLKTIDLSIIDEMIKEKVYRHNYSLIDDTETDELSWAIKALKDLKERLLSNK